MRTILALGVLGTCVFPLAAADPPKGRADRFGDPLPDGAIMRLGTLRGSVVVQSFGVAADGTVLTVGSDADVRVWHPNEDSPDPVVRLPVKVPADWFVRARISPDAKRIACCAPEAVVVYEWRGEKPPVEAASFKIEGFVDSLLFSPDGTQLVLIDRAYTIHLGDIKTGKSRVLKDGLSYVREVVFSGDGRRIGVNTVFGFLLFDAKSGEELGGWTPDDMHLSTVALDRTGEVLAFHEYKRRTEEYLGVRFVDAKTGKSRERMTGTTFGGWVSFAPDGKTVLVGDGRGVRWWNPAAGKLIRRFDGPTELGFSSYWGISPGQLTADGKTLVATSGKTLLRWDAETGEPRFREIHGARHFGPVAALGASADGKYLATGSSTQVKVWDAKTGKPVATFDSSWPRANNLEFAPDGKSLYAPAPDAGQLARWEIATGKELRRFTVDPKQPAQTMTMGFRLSENGKVLTVVTHARGRPSETAVLTTWDAATGERQFTKKLDGLEWQANRYLINFSPDALYASTCGNVFLTGDGPKRNLLPERTLGPGFRTGEFSGDGGRIAYSYVHEGDPYGVMRGVVYISATGVKLCDLPAGSGGLVALNSDGSILAAAGVEDLTFWDVHTGKLLARYQAPLAAEKGVGIHSFAEVLRFTPDGTKLISGHVDTTALVWAVPPRPAK